MMKHDLEMDVVKGHHGGKWGIEFHRILFVRLRELRG